MPNYSLFSVLGIEIEYMLVDKQTLDVRPISDQLISMLSGEETNEFSLGDIDVSNELVMHVIELKNNGPRPVSEPVVAQFQQAITQLQPVLHELHLQLLPTGAHPWMNPLTETKRWPHGNRDIYLQYDKIFNCQGHGWANLQSMHINLPFANDAEFGALHSLVRLLLPLLPAVAASTPILEQNTTGSLDSRLLFYEQNQRLIPSISGDIIPEFVTSETEYQERILQPMYRDIRQYDPEGLLQYEWLNSRGAIPKFDYNALEIRIVDSQEYVQGDIAIAHAVHAILKQWHEHSDYHLKHPCPTGLLKSVYNDTIKQGLTAPIDNGELQRQWQLPPRSMSAHQAWAMLIERVSTSLDQASQVALEHILHHGNLSERILKACQGDFSKPKLSHIYQRLATHLLTNQPFAP